jgi:uncharacterized protein YoxC
MSDEGFKALQVQAKELGTAFWACKSCLSFAVKMNSQMRAVTKQMEELTEKVEDNTKMIRGNTEAVEEVKKSVVTLDEKVEDMEKRIESRMYGELRERENRKAAVVLHGLKEPCHTIKDGKARTEDDFSRVVEVVKAAKADIRRGEMIYCWRLGEKGENPRPLVLGLESKGAKDHLLKQAKELRNTEFKIVHIVPYLTKKQMQEETDLEREAKEKNKTLTEEDRAKNLEWLVTGRKGEKRITKGVKRTYHTPATGSNGISVGTERRGNIGQREKRGRGSGSDNDMEVEQRRSAKSRK